MKQTIYITLLSLFLYGCSIENTIKWDGVYAHSFREGSGTEATPYLIASTQELAYLSEFCKNNSSSGVFFRLTGDLDMNGDSPQCGWIPIGSKYTFDGTFDGNNKSISNIVIYMEKQTKPGGLFSKIGKQGVVKSLHLNNTRMNYACNIQTGAVAGINDGVILNCRSTTVDRMYGGIVGSNNGNKKFGKRIFPVSTKDIRYLSM